MIRGKFQECCEINKNLPRGSYLWPKLFGWVYCQHCSCRVCTKERDKLELPKCNKDNLCTACVKKNNDKRTD